MNISGLVSHRENISANVHDAWWLSKVEQGFHAPVDCTLRLYEPIEDENEEILRERFCEKCHPDMVPYNKLPENIKDYDRVTVDAVLKAIEQII